MLAFPQQGRSIHTLSNHHERMKKLNDPLPKECVLFVDGTVVDLSKTIATKRVRIIGIR